MWPLLEVLSLLPWPSHCQEARWSFPWITTIPEVMMLPQWSQWGNSARIQSRNAGRTHPAKQHLCKDKPGNVLEAALHHRTGRELSKWDWGRGGVQVHTETQGRVDTGSRSKAQTTGWTQRDGQHLWIETSVNVCENWGKENKDQVKIGWEWSKGAWVLTVARSGVGKGIHTIMRSKQT